MLRAALRAKLPNYHVVLQWARDGKAEHMDVYAIPTRPTARSSDPLLAGLDSVMRSACALVGTDSLVQRASGAKIESFTNQLQTVDESKSTSNADSEAALAEAKKQWASAANDADMRGAVRSLFEVSVPVFELLTKTFGAFADAVVARGGRSRSYSTADNEWVSVVDDTMQYGKMASLNAPTFVFFPQAGSSPKQYAPLFTEMKKRCEHGLYLFIQPPGRDARADEPNETSCARYISQTASALKPYLIGSDSKDGPTLFIGDSWGAIAAFATAQELYACCGWSPTHVLVSGNASPAVTTTHMGLGTYSSKPMKNLTDEELIGFLKKSGVEEEDDSRLDAILPPFRADCELYEEYARPSALPVLPSKICVMRGKGDEVVTMSEISGWADEFDCDELSILRVPDATHHVHEEQPAVVADHVVSFLGLSVRTSLDLEGTPAGSPSQRRRRGGSPKSGSLPPALPFVRGIDAAALQTFREGNLLYRMGSAHGSRGELSHLADAK